LARYTEALCRLCRRENTKLFLKGDRCFTEKCAYSRRPYIPGQHHDTKGKKMSEYGKQLREKQKVKRIYGILERQFRTYFEMANRKTGETGENFLRILEKRLDNVVYRCGFAASRREARQIVNHGQVLINDKKVSISSYQVRAGEKITVKEKTSALVAVKKSLGDAQKKKSVPTWLEMNFDRNEAIVKNEPVRKDISTLPIQEQLIVELYSK